MDDRMDGMKQLSSVGLGLLEPQRISNLQKSLEERISLTEAIGLATKITGAYPIQDKLTDSYLGALAVTLADYPAGVARQCADLNQGVVRFSKFLPSVAEIVSYCEGFTEPLRRQVEVECRRQQQLKDRKEFEREQAVERKQRLSYQQLKEKYGDWHDSSRLHGLKKLEEKQAAEELLGRLAQSPLPLPPASPQLRILLERQNAERVAESGSKV